MPRFWQSSGAPGSPCRERDTHATAVPAGVRPGGGAHHAGGGACGVGADVGVLDKVSAPPPPAAGLVHQTQPNLVQPLRIDGPWTGDARDTQKSWGWTRAWLDPGLAGPWRLPLALAAPHPVVRQDQLSFSSSSSSGTQTGEMLDAGDRQTTRQHRNLSGWFRGP